MPDLATVLRRMTGLYVPYLEPFWEAADMRLVLDWLAGQGLPGAREELVAMLRASYPDAAEIVPTDTGKTALCAVLGCLGVAAGREVITPSYCCSSLIASLVAAGCEPVLADSDEDFNISGDSVAAALSPRTAAIVVPHLFGRQARSLAQVLDLARPRGIAVIEDVTQSFGLRLADGHLAGAAGDASIFSTGPGKPIMGPGGGWLLLNSAGTAATALVEESPAATRQRVGRFLERFTGPRWRRGMAEIRHSLSSRLVAQQTSVETNRLDWARQQCGLHCISDIEAALAVRQIARIGANLERRRDNARRWQALLAEAGVPCKMLSATGDTYAIATLRFPTPVAARLARRALGSVGVATEPCYTPLHLRPHGRDLRRTDMAGCESSWQTVFAVPVRPNLGDNDWRVIQSGVRTMAAALH